MSVCLSTYLPVYLSIYLSIYLTIYRSTYLCVYVSVYLYVDVHTHERLCAFVRYLLDSFGRSLVLKPTHQFKPWQSFRPAPVPSQLLQDIFHAFTKKLPMGWHQTDKGNIRQHSAQPLAHPLVILCCHDNPATYRMYLFMGRPCLDYARLPSSIFGTLCFGCQARAHSASKSQINLFSARGTWLRVPCSGIWEYDSFGS